MAGAGEVVPSLSNPTQDSGVSQAQPAPTVEFDTDGNPVHGVEIELACEMAYAGKAFRDHAAGLRGRVRAEKALSDAILRVTDDPRYMSTSPVYLFARKIVSDESLFWSQKLPLGVSRWGRKQLATIQDAPTGGYSHNEHDASVENGEEPLIRWEFCFSPAAAARAVFENRYDPRKPFRPDILKRAGEDDDTAADLERWTEVLYKHPVNEAYKERHPDFGFDAGSLVGLEALVSANSGLYPHEKFLTDSSLFEDVPLDASKIMREIEQVFGLLAVYFPGDSLITQYHELVANPSTTLGDLQNLNTMMRSRYNGLLKAKIAERKQILGDVINGRTNEVTEGESESLASR